MIPFSHPEVRRTGVNGWILHIFYATSQQTLCNAYAPVVFIREGQILEEHNFKRQTFDCFQRPLFPSECILTLLTSHWGTCWTPQWTDTGHCLTENCPMKKMHLFSATWERWISSQTSTECCRHYGLEQGKEHNCNQMFKLLIKIYHVTAGKPHTPPDCNPTSRSLVTLLWQPRPLNMGIHSVCARLTLLLCTALNHSLLLWEINHQPWLL